MKVNWRGREWEIRPATADERDTALDGYYGKCFTSAGIIIFDDTVSQDQQIMTVLHELAHVMFPEWNDEPVNTSKSEIGIFERDLKSIFDEVGIDLSPLVQEDEGDDSCDDTGVA